MITRLSLHVPQPEWVASLSLHQTAASLLMKGPDESVRMGWLHRLGCWTRCLGALLGWNWNALSGVCAGLNGFPIFINLKMQSRILSTYKFRTYIRIATKNNLFWGPISKWLCEIIQNPWSITLTVRFPQGIEWCVCVSALDWRVHHRHYSKIPLLSLMSMVCPIKTVSRA
jgi:hypothetical protein